MNFGENGSNGCVGGKIAGQPSSTLAVNVREFRLFCSEFPQNLVITLGVGAVGRMVVCFAAHPMEI